MMLRPWDPQSEQTVLTSVQAQRPTCERCGQPLRLHSATSGLDVKENYLRVEGSCGRPGHQVYTYRIRAS